MLPSVTEILHDAGLYGDIARWSDSEAMRRGRLVDAACNLLVMGKELPQAWEIEHPECVPFIDGYRAFLHDHKVTLIECAYEVINKAERYRGHPDQRVYLDEVQATLDLKSGGMPPITRLQLAGYECAQRAMGKPRSIRVGLQLTRGDYKLHYFDPAPFDYDEWTIIVRAYHVKRKYVAEGL